MLSKHLLVRRPMAAVFWDMLMVEFMQQEATIMSEVYR
jgi:hypothetical protein